MVYRGKEGGTSLRENGNFFCCQSICSVPLLCLPFLEVGGICLFVSLSAMQISNFALFNHMHHAYCHTQQICFFVVFLCRVMPSQDMAA